jgi:hypothetical protein
VASCAHQTHSAAPPRPRTSVPGREAVPRAWWSGRHGTRYLLPETSRIVHRLRLQRVMAAAAAAVGSRAEATAQGAGVLVRCGVARGRCTYVTGRAGAREGSGRHRSERLPPEIRGVPLHVLRVRCCTVALLAAGTAAALTSTIPAASPPSLFCSYPFSLLHTRAGRRGMTFGRICT